ncbi:MAG: ATP-binding protein [Proteobacteria bacterium]|nr:ATP-binding protein [Cystobacterineae bacterium]MCL2314357.1 ATP-binding protein [Pseudomonadota bacterium]
MSDAHCNTQGFSVDKEAELLRLKEAIEQCQHCRGSGLLVVQQKLHGRVYEETRPCKKRRLLHRASLLAAAKIPPLFQNVSFGDYKPKNDEQSRALEMVKMYASQPPVPRGFLLSGPVGTGKTHLLAATLRQLILEFGVRASYVEISLLYAAIRRGFQEGKSGGEIINPLANADLLAIDELGKGRLSPFELETLDELISRRYNEKKPTLFATNYTLGTLGNPQRPGNHYVSTSELWEKGKEPHLLVERIGERIFSRICHVCDFAEFPPATPDLRKANKRRI